MTISLDSLDREKFAEITAVDALDKVVAAIDAAKDHGFEPVKINAVIVRGRNDDEIVDFARFARERDLKIRFIEYMPLDSGHEWQREEVVAGREIFEAINSVFPLELVDQNRGSETSWKYSFADRLARRDRDHCTRDRDVLRSLLPHPPDRRRPDPDLPVFDRRAQPP